MKSQLEIAIDLAAQWHNGQRYGKLPYMAHLMDVDRWVVERNRYSKEVGDRVDCLRAIAFLHDILEDTECTMEDLLHAGVYLQVRSAVYWMTKQKHESYRGYIEGVLVDDLAREVKICDTMANLTQSVKKNNAKRIAKYTRQLAILSKGEYFE